MNGTIYSFEKLQVWQSARLLVKQAYPLLKKFPYEERYDLCSQLRRSLTSIVSNIAEGSGRSSYKEKIHFLEIAYGSLMESYCQLIIASDLDYIKLEEVENLKTLIDGISKMLIGLRYAYTEKANTKDPHLNPINPQTNPINP